MLKKYTCWSQIAITDGPFSCQAFVSEVRGVQMVTEKKSHIYMHTHVLNTQGRALLTLAHVAVFRRAPLLFWLFTEASGGVYIWRIKSR